MRSEVEKLWWRLLCCLFRLSDSFLVVVDNMADNICSTFTEVISFHITPHCLCICFNSCFIEDMCIHITHICL